MKLPTSQLMNSCIFLRSEFYDNDDLRPGVRLVWNTDITSRIGHKILDNMGNHRSVFYMLGNAFAKSFF